MGACPVRGRTGQGKPLSVRFAHSPGFSGWFSQPGGIEWLKIPAHEVQRDFPGLRCQPPHPLVSPAGSVGSRQSATGARTPPPAPKPWRYLYPLRRGRGILILIFNRIFKGARSHLPVRSVLDGARWAPGPPCTPMVDSCFRVRKPPNRGLSKGGRQAPLWNEIIELYPPPVRKRMR